MSKVNKKFLALAATAALGVAGIAWAADIALESKVTDFNVPAGDNLMMTGTDTTSGLAITFDAAATITTGTGQKMTLAPALGKALIQTAAGNIEKNGVGELVLAGANAGTPDAGTQNTFAVTSFFDVNRGVVTAENSNSFGFARVALSGDSQLNVRKNDVSLGHRRLDGSTLDTQDVTLTYDVPAPYGYVPVTFDVEKLDADLHLRVYAGIKQTADANKAIGTALANKRDANVGITLVKQNAGKMIVDKKGSLHTGGTHVKGGTLEMFSDSTARFGAELGDVYDARVEANLPYNANVSPAWNNFLTVDAGATLETNVDQYVGALNGAGSVIGKLKNGNVKPVITVWNNMHDNYANNSKFTGNITGNMHLRLDNNRDAGTTEPHALQTLRLEGNNAWNGETWVADGILSAKNIAAIGTSTIRVGLDGSNNTGGNGLADELYATSNKATLHFTADSVVPNKTVTEKGAGLGADDRATVTYKDIAVYDKLVINPWLNAAKTAPVNYQGTVKFSENIKYAGVITAPTDITIDRGRLQIWAQPVASGDFATINVKENARLGFGPTVQDMMTRYNVNMESVASLEGFITPNNVKTTNAFVDMYDSAIMRFNTFDVTALGDTIADANKYIRVKLTRENNTAIPAGSYIPIVSARNFIGQDALFDVPTQTHKVRPYIENLDSNNLESQYLQVETRTYDGVIYAKVVKDIPAIDSGDVSPDPKPVPGDSSSSGCSTGAFAGLAGLLLAPLAFLRKKD